MKYDLNIYKYKDYKLYILSLIKQMRPQRGGVSRLSEAANCQASYLSQALHGKPHLTPDHALGIGTFLELNEKEIEYFLALVDFARASSLTLKNRLQKRLQDLRAEADQIGSRLDRPKIEFSPEQLQKYYSSWLYSAAHLLSSLETLRDSDFFSQRLKLSKKFTLEILSFLEELGFVKKHNNQWLHSGREVHISKDSPLIAMHHQNWRGQAVVDAQLNRSESLHFTGVYALSLEDFERVRELLLQAMKEAQKLISPSRSEEVICFSLDYFSLFK